jgi:hypothetical protein
LASLPKLGELRLGLTRNINDAAVDKLLGLKHLKLVYLAGSGITPAGLARLHADGGLETR